MDIWEEMYEKAKEEYHLEEVSPFITAHHVVAAVQSESGKTVILKDIVPNWWGDKRYNK